MYKDIDIHVDGSMVYFCCTKQQTVDGLIKYLKKKYKSKGFATGCTVSKKDEENRKLRINSMEKIFTRIYNKKQIRLSTNYS